MERGEGERFGEGRRGWKFKEEKGIEMVSGEVDEDVEERGIEM